MGAETGGPSEAEMGLKPLEVTRAPDSNNAETNAKRLSVFEVLQEKLNVRGENNKVEIDIEGSDYGAPLDEDWIKNAELEIKSLSPELGATDLFTNVKSIVVQYLQESGYVESRNNQKKLTLYPVQYFIKKLGDANQHLLVRISSTAQKNVKVGIHDQEDYA